MNFDLQKILSRVKIPQFDDMGSICYLFNIYKTIVQETLNYPPNYIKLDKIRFLLN